MGRQINYYMDYESFLTVAQTALDMGLAVIPREQNGKVIPGHDIGTVAPEIISYYFYVPEAGALQINDETKALNLTGNNIIEAGYSHISAEERTIGRARIYSAAGEYDKAGNWLPRPECTAKAYNALCRAVKKAAPRTDFRAADIYFTRKWGHSVVCDRREYISPFCRSLTEEGYEIYG